MSGSLSTATPCDAARFTGTAQRDNAACQACSFTQASSYRVPRPVDMLQRSLEHVRRFGMSHTVAKVASFLRRLLQHPERRLGPTRPVPRAEEVLRLQPGELAEVRSEAEIEATLTDGRCNGLVFLPAMRQFCGRRYVVLKRMERMFQEESGTLRKVRNTVLLDGVMCDGLLMRCDRSCFFYWREAWLRRVDVAETASSPAAESRHGQGSPAC